MSIALARSADVNGPPPGMNNETTLWRTPPERLTLGDDDVHVWRVRLDQPQAQLQSFYYSLAEDEKVRARRFSFQRHRERFIVARGTLRALLGYYLDRQPSQLCFDYGTHGKPALARDTGEATVRFNLSHSDELALLAVARGREIGVDIELVSAEVANERIAERFFSPLEVLSLRSLPVNTQTEAFFNCWTRKEAYIKARGEGLSLPLDSFEVSLKPGEAAALLSTQTDSREASRWCFRKLVPDPCHVGALAVEGHGWELQCLRWGE